MKKPDDTAQVKVLRDGEEHEFTVALRPVSRLFPLFLVLFKGESTGKINFESSIVFAYFYHKKFHALFCLECICHTIQPCILV